MTKVESFSRTSKSVDEVAGTHAAQGVISVVHDLMDAWSRKTRPVLQDEWLPVVGLDRGNTTDQQIDDLFFVRGAGLVSASGPQECRMDFVDILDTSTLRNSFYPEIYRHHNRMDQFALRLTLTGRCRAQISVSRMHNPVEVLLEKDLAPPINHPKDAPYTVSIPLSLQGLGEGARLFWRIRAQHDGVVLHDAAWCGQAPAEASGRMVVALRTFGRTRDILALLKGFQQHAVADPDSAYARMMRNAFFMVLDTSPNVSERDYTALAQAEGLNCAVIAGANLGGGGNMSQVMHLIIEAGVEPDEILLLDDDLSLSVESLYRHWAVTLFRSDDTVFSLPIFTKSNPRKMWEDGAFWGRYQGTAPDARRDRLSPLLLRHNLSFEGAAHLDLLAGRNYPEYCTFIFLSLPWTLFRKMGYPLAFFLRGDDIEYCLRVRRFGARIMSNPNTAAWHEPAHSYGQEYMSIAHGVIINMAYGQDDPEGLIGFFQRQFIRHLSVNDVAGLTIYRDILRDLMAMNVFLEHGFTKHYVARLGEYKKFDSDFEYVPATVLDSLRQSARGGSVADHPFLYMGVEGRDDVGTVVLHNVHTDMHHVYRFDDPKIRQKVTQIAAEFALLIQRLGAEFDAMQAHYHQRSQTSSGPDFWSHEISMHKPLTVLAVSQGVS